jgi:ribosomal protein S27AE
VASDEREQQQQQRCAKCGGEMAEGFVINRPMTGQFVMPEDWVEGAPVPSIWTGTKLGGKERHHVATYRCGRCGYLESYAR